jgi:hypothetical protein
LTATALTSVSAQLALAPVSTTATELAQSVLVSA